MDLEKTLAAIDKAAPATDRKSAKLRRDADRLKVSNLRSVEEAEEVKRRLAKAS